MNRFIFKITYQTVVVVECPPPQPPLVEERVERQRAVTAERAVMAERQAAAPAPLLLLLAAVERVHACVASQGVSALSQLQKQNKKLLVYKRTTTKFKTNYSCILILTICM